MAVFCSECGAAVAGGDKFCGECGKPLDAIPLAAKPRFRKIILPTSLVALLAVVVGVFFYFSSGLKTSDARLVAGRWKEVGGSEIIEFRRDGTLAIESTGLKMTGTYKVEGGRLKMEMQGLGASAGPLGFKLSVSGKELVLEEEGGPVRRFQRSNG